VLVVEDNEGLRESLSEFLRTEGYQVRTAETGGDALGILANGAFDLVIADFRMPGLTGMEFLREARAARPHLRAILMTGMPEEMVSPAEVRATGIAFVRKPFEAQEMLALVRRVLAG
jgi:DNA-binding NtrC family response regulator